MTVREKINIINVKENGQVSEKQNISDAKYSFNKSSIESRMNTNPAIQVKTSKLTIKVEFSEDKKKVDTKKESNDVFSRRVRL